MKQMDYFIDLYCSLPRGGPGSNECTRKAFALIKDLPPEPDILDLGCGPGMQTVELLKLCKGKVTALDFLPQMISRLKETAQEEGLSDRLETVQEDMNEMTFEPESFDLIWAEGAIYLLGFEKGLKKIREYIKPGGFVAVSEVVWLKDNPPSDLVDFWKAYPEIDTVENKLEVIKKTGYERIGHFILPASSWTDFYYDFLAERTSEYEEKWKGIPEAESVLEEARSEMAIFEKYSDYYSYAFFVMRK